MVLSFIRRRKPDVGYFQGMLQGIDGLGDDLGS